MKATRRIIKTTGINLNIMEQGITVLDGVECWMYQHGLRHMGEIELSRSFVGLQGMTS
jgi:hypothetical protein